MKDLIEKLKSLQPEQFHDLMLELGAFYSEGLTNDIENAIDTDLSEIDEYEDVVKLYIFPK